METNQIKIVEVENVERDYGTRGVNAVIDHPKYGRILIRDGFGGMDNLEGGNVRWKHGSAIQLKPDDTIDKIKALSWNDWVTNWEAMLEGYDDERPYMSWNGHMIESVVKKAGLI